MNLYPDYNFIQLLIDNGCDVNLKDLEGCTPLHHVCKKDNPQVNAIQLLFANNANINNRTKNGSSALHFLCQNQSIITIEPIQLLILLGADVNSKNYDLQTPLHFVCRNKTPSLEIINCLIEKGANVNLPDKQGMSPLHLLAQRDEPCLQVIDFLLNNGANPNSRNNDNETPLHLLCLKSKPSVELIQLLIDGGAEINAKDDKEEIGSSTPLHYVCSQNNPSLEVIQVLIENGSELNEQDNHGNLPIHLLLAENSRQMDCSRIVYYLLKSGTDINVENMYRRKPIDYVWGDSINKENITQMFQITFEGLKDDFIQFYKSKEFTDFEINEIPVHKELIELRTGLTAEFVKQKCEYFNKPDIVQFIKWIYTDEIPQKSESFSKLLTLLEIEDFQTRSLENAISDLFFDEKGKDFEILFENGSIPVHKLILQCRTGLFHGMFLSTSGNISKVRDYTKKSIKAVKLLIEYLYLDSLDIFQLNDDIIQDLSDCVDYYQLNPRCNLKYELYYH